MVAVGAHPAEQLASAGIGVRYVPIVLTLGGHAVVGTRGDGFMHRVSRETLAVQGINVVGEPVPDGDMILVRIDRHRSFSRDRRQCLQRKQYSRHGNSRYRHAALLRFLVGAATRIALTQRHLFRPVTSRRELRILAHAFRFIEPAQDLQDFAFQDE